MDCIASELTVKIHMSLKQRHRNTFAGQQESENRPGRPSTNDTASRFFYAFHLVYMSTMSMLTG
jgi:hypothetical protein